MWELCVPIPGPGIDVCSYASPACPLKTGMKETVQVSDLYLDKSFPNVSHKGNYPFCQFVGACLVHLFSDHCMSWILDDSTGERGWLFFSSPEACCQAAWPLMSSFIHKYHAALLANYSVRRICICSNMYRLTIGIVAIHVI